MSLFTLNNFCVSCSLDYLKSKLEAKIRLSLSGSQCTSAFNKILSSDKSYLPLTLSEFKNSFSHISYVRLLIFIKLKIF